MCLHGLTFKSMQAVLKIPTKTNHETLLMHVCQAMDTLNFRILQIDRGLLIKLANFIRYKLPTEKGKKTIRPWERAYITIQIVLEADDRIKTNYIFARGSQLIMKDASRIINCVVNVLTAKGASVALQNAIELEGAINGQVWHDGCRVLRQIEGVGAAYAATLAKDGLGDFTSLRNADPSRIEFTLKRNPPFGLQLLEKIRELPCLSLEVSDMQENNNSDTFSCKVFANTEGPTTNYKCHLIVIQKADEVRLVHYQMIDNSFEGIIPVEIENWSKVKNITISLLCSMAAGLNIHKILSNARYHEEANNHPSIDYREEIQKNNVFLSSLKSEDLNFAGNLHDTNANNNVITEESSIFPTTAIRSPICYQTQSTPAANSPVSVAKENIDASTLLWQSDLQQLLEYQEEVNCGHRCRNKLKCRHQCCKGRTNSKKPRFDARSAKVVSLEHCKNVKDGIKRWMEQLARGESSSEIEVQYRITDGLSVQNALDHFLDHMLQDA